MTASTISLAHVSICAYKSFENESQLLSHFNAISSIQKPKDLQNQIVEIDREEPEDSEIIIGESGNIDPRDQEENKVTINLYDGDRDDIHIHAYLDSDYIEDFSQLYQSIISEIGEIRIVIFTCNFTLEVPFNELDFSTEVQMPTRDEEFTPTGVRFDNEEGNDYLIQSNLDGDSSVIRYGKEDEFRIGESSATTFIEDQLDIPRQFIKELEP